MAYLALDKATGDLIKKNGGGVTRVSEGRFVVQQIQSKLRTFLGEWVLDEKVGWLNFSDYEKGFNQGDIEKRAREIILSTQDVISIDTFESFYSNRKFTISFSASTTYGSVDLTIPWGDS